MPSASIYKWKKYESLDEKFERQLYLQIKYETGQMELSLIE